MTPNPLRRRFHHHMRPMLQRLTNRSARPERVVHNQWQIMLLRQRHKRLKVRHRQPGIADGLQINRLRLGIDQRLKRLHLHTIRKPRLNTDALEGVFELIVGATVQMRSGDKVIAHRSNVVDCNELRGMPRSRRQRSHSALKRRHPLLEHIRRRIHQPRVNVPKFLQGKQLGPMLGALELIRRRLINRHGP